MRASEADLAIDVSLLQDWPPEASGRPSGAPLLPWSNLGLWTAGPEYRTAAAALARDLAAAVNLQAGDRVLDLACGYGASLALWGTEFGVQACDAVEAQRRCTDALQHPPPEALQHLYTGWLEDLVLPEAAYDVVLSVDAAYHFADPATFPTFLQHRLRPQGRFAFHTLALAEDVRSTRWAPVLRQAAIRNPAPVSVWQQAWASDVWDKIEVVDQTDAVLGGFPDFVRRRAQQLPWRRKVSKGWSKVVLTAWLCRALRKEGQVRYVRIAGRRTQARAR